jgi:hypothetical protein
VAAYHGASHNRDWQSVKHAIVLNWQSCSFTNIAMKPLEKLAARGKTVQDGKSVFTAAATACEREVTPSWRRCS